MGRGKRKWGIRLVHDFDPASGIVASGIGPSDKGISQIPVIKGS